MSEPGVAQVPKLLARTALRMVARLLFVVAAVLFIACVTIACTSLILCTWRTPRPRRVQAITNLATAAVELGRTFRD